MKRTLLVLTACVLMLGCAIASASAPEPAGPQISWYNYTLEVRLLSDNAAYLPQDNLPPAEGKYVLLRVGGVDGEIAMEDIEEACELIALKDLKKGEYYGMVNYMVRGIDFDQKTGLFATKPTQATFDLIYDVPLDTALENLALAVAAADGSTIDEFDLTSVPWELPEGLTAQGDATTKP